MPIMPNAFQEQYKEGQIVVTQRHTCGTMLYPKNGTTQGSAVVTGAGTPAYMTAYPYTVTLTRASDGSQHVQTGNFFYVRQGAAASLADFLAKFATHLTTYWDVIATVASATTLNVVSSFWGYTPNISMNFAGVTMTSALTNAQAPRPILPGTLLVATPDSVPGNFTHRIGALPTTANFFGGNTKYGIVMDSMYQPKLTSSDDVVYNVMFAGEIAVRLYGTAPIVPATAGLTLGLNTSSQPGRFAVAGLGLAADVQNIGLGASSSTLMMPTFRVRNSNVPVGGIFKLSIDA